MKITLKQAIEKIDSLEGQFFTVEFIKKDNTIRVMNCRKEVKKHLKGGVLKFDPRSKGLLPVFDLHKQGYRMINFNTMLSLSVNKIKFEIV